MKDYVQPCADPKNDPEDWFISQNGKQYSDDPLLPALEDMTDEQKADIHRRAVEAVRDRLDEDGTTMPIQEAIEEALAGAEEDVRRQALRDRRHAKDACHVDCYFRGFCLDIALRTRPQHGTWGGYFEEELKVLYSEIDNRRKKKEG